jgi:hypothetical protein
VLPVVAAGAALWRARLGARTTAVMALAVVVPLAAWQLLDAAVFPDTTGRGEAVTGITAQETDVQRLTVWRVMSEAALDRPVLGWGPGSAQSGYLAAASSQDLRDAGRQWYDAHDLFIETAVTTGLLGLAALIALVTMLAVRAVRGSRDRAWAFGAAAGLAAYSLVEPIGLVLTPLLFLFAGVAAGSDERAADEAPVRGPVAWGVTAVLVVATVVSVQMLASATFERWGRVYGEVWALDRSLAIQPWRLSAAERLAIRLAIDGRAGDAAAGARAREVISAAVDRHPWDGDVRFVAADVETLLRDEEAALAWIAEQLERFPGDASTVEDAASTEAENGLPGA